MFLVSLCGERGTTSQSEVTPHLGGVNFAFGEALPSFAKAKVSPLFAKGENSPFGGAFER